MGVSTLHRNIEKLSAQDIGCAYTTANHGGPCAVGACVRPLGTAKSKFHDAVSVCGITYPCGLGCDKTLVVDDI